MPLYLDYHWRRLRSRGHRFRLALHARGWRGLVARLADAGGAVRPGVGPARDARGAAPLPRPPGAARRVLLVDATTPRPDRDSGSLRAFHLLRLLAEAGHAVDFLPDDRRDAGAYADAIEAMGIRVLAGAPGDPRWFARHAYDLVVISRYHLAEFLIPLVRRLAPATRIVLDTVDLHHLRESREAELKGDRVLARLAATTRARELASVRRADLAWVVSPHEARVLADAVPDSPALVVPNIHAVEGAPPGFEARSGLLFVGGGQHPPNLDAVAWLVGQIFPLVRARLPDCELHLAGQGLEAALDGRAPPPGVRLHGHVPDLGALLGRARLGLAPLRFGAGVKGKVNQYMAAGLPVVSTSCGAEGMHLHDGRDVLIGDAAPDFADAIVRLYGDAPLWHALADAGRANIARHFSFDTARDALAATFDRLFA